MTLIAISAPNAPQGRAPKAPVMHVFAARLRAMVQLHALTAHRADSPYSALQTAPFARKVLSPIPAVLAA